MNRAEAQELYNKHNGQAFFMAREEPDKYREFSRQYGFDHPDWDEELIRHGFDTLWDDPKHVWIKHHSIQVTLRRGLLDPGYWGGRMLDEMEKMPAALDRENKILILQNMAGDNCGLDNGWVYLFCIHTRLADRMIEICERLMDFSCEGESWNGLGWKDPQSRLNSAKARYRAALNSWRSPFRRIGFSGASLYLDDTTVELPHKIRQVRTEGRFVYAVVEDQSRPEAGNLYKLSRDGILWQAGNPNAAFPGYGYTAFERVDLKGSTLVGTDCSGRRWAIWKDTGKIKYPMSPSPRK